MDITINIDSTQMGKLVERGIAALDDETVRNIARQSLSEAFKSSELARDMLFVRNIHNYELREWVKNAIANAVTAADYEKFKDMVFEALGERARDIIVETLARTLTNNLFAYEQRSAFAEEIVTAVKERGKS